MLYLFFALLISCSLSYLICAKLKVGKDNMFNIIVITITMCLFSFTFYWYWTIYDDIRGLSYLFFSSLCYMHFMWMIFDKDVMPNSPLFLRKTAILISCFYGFFISFRFLLPPMRSQTEVVVGFLLGAFSLWMIILVIVSGRNTEKFNSVKKMLVMDGALVSHLQ